MDAGARLATPTGVTLEEWRALRQAERRLVTAWHLENAGNDDGREWWPWAIRRLPIEARLRFAASPDLDAQRIELERKRVARSVTYFVAHYGHVQGAEGEAPEPFLLWPAQVRVLEAMVSELRLIVLKARQLGLTWLALHYGYWLQALGLATVNAKILALSKDGGEASKLLLRARRINDLLPTYLRPHEDPSTRGSLSRFKLLGRGTMISLTSNPAAARSETARLAILDEAAFVRNKAFSATHTAAQPSLGQRGQEIVLSTGNGPAEAAGDGQGFAQLWQDARAGRNDFAAIFLKTSTHPERTPAWREREQRRYLTDEEFYAEHPETEDEALMGPQGKKVFSPQGLNACAVLGAEYDRLRLAGDLAPPDRGQVTLGLDHGEHYHAVHVWPLERGGMYVWAETVTEYEEASDYARATIAKQRTLAPWAMGLHHEPLAWLSDVRYDSAGAGAQRTWTAIARKPQPDGWPYLPVTKIAFNAYKRETIGYLRRLVKRTAQGADAGLLAIGAGAPELLRQLRGLEWPDDGGDLPVDGDDHGPDALIAAAAPILQAHREG